jgi:hypothetical protein
MINRSHVNMYQSLQVRSNAKDVRSNVLLHYLFEQGRTLARRGMSGEHRYATMLEKAEVRSTARTVFDRTVPGRNSKDLTESKTVSKNANLIFLNFIYTKARNK